MQIILWLGAIIFGFDQLTKIVSVRSLVLNRPAPVIDGCFNLTLIYNTGAAFGLFFGQNIPLIIISALTIATLIVFGYVYSKETALFKVSVGLILGGAAGNLFDRLSRGYVVDFLDFYFRTHHWPAFNVADSAICAGTFLLVIYFLKTK